MRRSQEYTTRELSARELQVLEMLNTGMSQKQISYELQLDPSTVSTLVYRIGMKAKSKGYRRRVVYVNEQGNIWRG